MSKIILTIATLLFVISCSSSKVKSSTETTKLQEEYESLVGKANKQDLVQRFGSPNWCHKNEGDSTEQCRFLKQTGTQWVGKGTNKSGYTTYDEIIADFDDKGVLKSVKAQVQR